MQYYVAAKGVYYSNGKRSIGSFNDCDIVQSVDDVPTPDLDTFIEAIRSKRGESSTDRGPRGRI